MAASEAQKKATAKYQKAHYERLTVQVEKGERAKIAAYAQRHGKSVQGLVRELLHREMEQNP